MQINNYDMNRTMEQNIIDIVYDLMTQNPIAGCYEISHDDIADMLIEVDSSHDAFNNPNIKMRDERGNEYQLTLVKTYSPKGGKL